MMGVHYSCESKSHIKKFANVTLACEGGYQMEAQKVVLAEKVHSYRTCSKATKKTVTMTEGEQHLKQCEMVLFICTMYTHFKLQLTTILFENKKYLQSTFSIGPVLYS